MPDRGSSDGHGWWPYILPYVSFLILVELGRRVPDALALPMLAIKPSVPAALMFYYARQGAYPELRGFLRKGVAWIGVDVAVGLGLAVLWVAPYLWIAAIRPESLEGFDPAIAGEALAPVAMSLRFAGYALVTPFFEELFIRSFVMRYADVYPGPGDFRALPLARFTWRSFATTVVVFSIGHVPWEWWVAVPWVVLTNLWFYRRGHIGSVILVHAVTNAAILVWVLLAGGEISVGGDTLSLWFFV